MLLLFCKLSINKCRHDHAKSLSVIGGQLITNQNNNKVHKLLNIIKSDTKKDRPSFKLNLCEPYLVSFPLTTLVIIKQILYQYKLVNSLPIKSTK